MSILPLHAGLPTDDQLRIFEPAGPATRKVIISTNIAEVHLPFQPFACVQTIQASVTIDGIRTVVDCGFVKVIQSALINDSLSPLSVPQIKTYNPTTALSTLATVPISLASATQRAGRAGRTSSGVCYRLYPESALAALPRTTAPEITRTDLTTPFLQLKALGIDDLVKFEWVTNPPAEAVLRALEGLVAAGMVGEDGRLTVVGEKVAECPVEVGIARMVCAVCPHRCAEALMPVSSSARRITNAARRYSRLLPWWPCR